MILQRLVDAMDVSFIPSDPDGPLVWSQVFDTNTNTRSFKYFSYRIKSQPLSSSYRDSLRKLCEIMEKKKPIPPELEAKKAVMKKLCVRLKKDDKNIVAGTRG